jgi:hypothetical protein
MSAPACQQCQAFSLQEIKKSHASQVLYLIVGVVFKLFLLVAVGRQAGRVGSMLRPRQPVCRTLQSSYVSFF